MGTAISPRGVMPKNRVPLSRQGRCMRSDFLNVANVVRLAGTPPCAPPADVHTADMYAVVPVLIRDGRGRKLIRRYGPVSSLVLRRYLPNRHEIESRCGRVASGGRRLSRGA